MVEKMHTAGPWQIVPYGDGDSLVVHAGEDERVCFMATPGESPGAMSRIEANARLIAAAPAMYEALEALLAEVKAHGFGGDNEDIQNACRKAEAALQSAKVGSHEL
jgi:hypothetical protein